MAKSRDPKLRVSSAYRSTRRTIRRPQHPFMLKTRPFQIQPFMIAPILPGETLRNLLCQTRVVTDPLKHPLVGWWTEYFFFYVKHRDLNYHNGNDAFEKMVLDPTFDAASISSAADLKNYNAAGGINYSKMCLETVTEWFFRDQGEDWNETGTLDGLPLAQISGRNWLDSLTLSDSYRTDSDVNLDLNADGDITVREMMEAQAHWEALRSAGLEDMDYEDYLRTYGVMSREPDASPNLYRPELIRYKREWSYPTNTVNPENGQPSSAVSWAVAFRADKDRYFKEPGFIFGVTVARPKTYISNQAGSLAHEMKNVFSWLPATLQNDYEKGFIEIQGNAGPLAGIFDDGDDGLFNYTVDIRDLFTYGDQFVNYQIDAASSAVGVVTDDGKVRYPDATSIDDLFSGANKTIRQDGIVTLAISGRQKDNSPRGIPLMQGM